VVLCSSNHRYGQVQTESERRFRFPSAPCIG
jgi:hypothetical protein